MYNAASLDLSLAWRDLSNLASSVNLLIPGFDETMVTEKFERGQNDC